MAVQRRLLASEVDLRQYLTGIKRLLVPLMRPKTPTRHHAKVMDFEAAASGQAAAFEQSLSIAGIDGTARGMAARNPGSEAIDTPSTATEVAESPNTGLNTSEPIVDPNGLKNDR